MRISDWSSDVCSSDLLRSRSPRRLRPGPGLSGKRPLPARRRGAGVCRVGTAHLQRLAGDIHALEMFKQLARNAFGQVDQAVIVADVDAADVADRQSVV